MDDVLVFDSFLLWRDAECDRVLVALLVLELELIEKLLGDDESTRVRLTAGINVLLLDDLLDVKTLLTYEPYQLVS